MDTTENSKSTEPHRSGRRREPVGLMDDLAKPTPRRVTTWTNSVHTIGDDPAPLINYTRIGVAENFYVNNEYSRIDAPWLITREASIITSPDPTQDYVVDGNFSLPASGEQSLYQMAKEGKITNGKFMATTPCFRREPRTNEFTRLQFMKVELMHLGGRDVSDLMDMVGLAEQYFNDALPNTYNVVRMVTGVDGGVLSAIDLCVIDRMGKVFELGSYGTRKVDDIEWVYGTGLAEPRFGVVNAHLLNETR